MAIIFVFFGFFSQSIYVRRIHRYVDGFCGNGARNELQ